MKCLPTISFVFVIFSILVIKNIDGANNAKQGASERCTLPKHPENGRWSVSGSKSSTPGKKVASGTLLNIRCNGKYTLNGPSLIECKNGEWKSSIGKCLETCPPVLSTSSTKVVCTINGKTSDKCDRAINATVATFKCAAYYENAELNRNPFRTCLNGQWNQEIPLCTPICGQKPKSSGNKSKAYYPWNVALYIERDNEYLYTCTGTLINERTIITAAHCVSDEFGQKKNTSLFTVAVGKSSEEYDSQDDQDAQYSEVQEMFIPNVFKGRTRKYYGDVAVLITKNNFVMTKRVQPICTDWTNKYSKEFENPSRVWIAGPFAREYIPSLKNVTEIEVPLVNETDCYDQLAARKLGDPNYEPLYTPAGMYCSGYINSDKAPNCLVDHGVGLITKNQYNNKYYLIGVLSLFPSLHREKCDNKRWTLYTKISNYMVDFITRNVNLYVPVNRPYFQTSCGIKSVKAQTLIVNGKNVTKGDYPWQAAIYTIENSKKNQICGGSLINQRVILTAAHCVTDSFGKILPKERYAVAVGKYFRNYDDERDTEAQFSSVKNIFVPTQYQGDYQNFVGDIAIVITENSFTLTKQVHPVCLDWDDKYENQYLRPSVRGFVTGWGYTQQGQNPSEELKELEVPYIEKENCSLPEDYEVYLTFDKLCAGFQKKSKSVCSGDSGGGLVFKNTNDDRYYLGGIVSLSPQAPTGGCDSQEYALYTRVSVYVKSFILEKVRLYWA